MIEKLIFLAKGFFWRGRNICLTGGAPYANIYMLC